MDYDFLRDTENKDFRITDDITRINVSIDAGSSESRTHVWNGNPRTGTVIGIDSAYSVITNDISSIASQSETLYDNLEIEISDITEDKEDKVFNNVHIVKGGLLEDLRLPIARTSSNTGKGLQETTFINAISNIGIRAYGIGHTNGSVSDTIVAKVSIALPQEDITSTKRQEDVKNKLEGVYKFSLPRFGFFVTIIIDRDDIFLFDEAQASIGFWRINNKETAKDFQGVLVVDAGGRSVDLSLMLKGRVIQKGSYTCKFGGQKFIDMIIDKYINDTGSDMPTKAMIMDALDTGYLQSGNDKIDITGYIDGAKQEITRSLMTDIAAILDLNDVRMTQINIVLCTGRLMKVTKNDKTSVPSLADYIGAEVDKLSPSTYIGKMDDEYSLVKGLSLARFAYDAKSSK